MEKKLLLMVMSIFSLFPMFSEGQQEGPKQIPPVDMDRTYEITVGTWSQQLADTYAESLKSAEFTSKFPNISVSFMVADFSGHHSRAVTTIAAGEATNQIEMLEVAQIAKFVEGGGLTYLDEAPFNGFEAGKDIVDFAMGNATSESGKLVAFPVDIAPAVLFYRKSITDAAGVDMTKLNTWDQFIEAGKKLTIDKDGDGVIDQYAITHAVEVSNVPLNGGMAGWFDREGNPFEPKEKFILALELVKMVRDAGIDGDLGTWSPPWLQAYADGTVAATINGAWFGGGLETWIAPETKGDWRVAYIPGKSYASMGGSYFTIPEQVPADEKAAAWEVIKFLSTSDIAQLASFVEQAAFPVMTTLYDHPVMNEGVEFFGGQKVRQIFADVARNMPNDPVSEFDPIARAIFGNATTMVLVEGLSPEEAYQDALNELMAVIE
ncbi:MAG: extracellular solute-binding protein [Spirochaetales bacterium]|nr:extracellular solute-binding protein [Spirochaetales bacterium]